MRPYLSDCCRWSASPPSRHGGVLKRLRKVPEHVAVRAQLRLHQRPRRARAKSGQLALLVQVQQAVEAAQVDRQDGPLADGAVQVPGHTGATGKRITIQFC